MENRFDVVGCKIGKTNLDGVLGDSVRAILLRIANLDRYSGRSCVDQVGQFVPEKVLEPIYEDFRYLPKGRHTAQGVGGGSTVKND